MYFIAIFFTELLIIFILSRFVTSDISQFAYRISRSSKFAVYTLSFLFLPGTVIHELSHYITAQLLFVRTGEMEFVPKIHEDRVKLGSVQIEKTDPVRRALIGVAPFLIGTSLLMLILFIAEFYDGWGSIWHAVIICYILFEIGNTMFSSKKDMEGVLELFACITIVGAILFFAGVRIPEYVIRSLTTPSTVSIFQKGSLYLLIPITIDIAIISMTKLSLRYLR